MPWRIIIADMLCSYVLIEGSEMFLTSLLVSRNVHVGDKQSR